MKYFFLLSLAGAMAGVACTSSTEPVPVPLQFSSVTGGDPQAVSITGQPSRIIIVGGYRGAACGAAGAHAERNGNEIAVTVGTNLTTPCDAALISYNYSATLLDMNAGSYKVSVFHITNGGTKPTLAASTNVVIQ
jgi:hypothetical protein